MGHKMQQLSVRMFKMTAMLVTPACSHRYLAVPACLVGYLPPPEKLYS